MKTSLPIAELCWFSQFKQRLYFDLLFTPKVQDYTIMIFIIIELIKVLGEKISMCIAYLN